MEAEQTGDSAKKAEGLRDLEREGETHVDQVRDSDLPQSPDFKALRSEPELVKELEEADLEEARAEADRQEFANILEISEWAQDDMERAPKTVRQAAKAMSRVDLAEVASKSSALVEKFEELGMGEMKTGFWATVFARFLPEKTQETLKEFKQRAKPVMRDKDQIIEATDGEKVKPGERVQPVA